MNEDEEMVNTVRRSPRRMDFAPRPRGNSAPVSPVKRVVKTPQMTEAEERRREIARREVARREEIHRQIEAQKEADIIAERRAIAARKDLARRLDIEREENAEALANHKRELEEARIREEKARRKAMIEQRAIRERQRILAEKRAAMAREELARRREDEAKLKKAVVIKKVVNPSGSKDPLQGGRPAVKPAPAAKPAAKPEVKKSLFKRNKVEQRLGSVEDFEAELNSLEKENPSFDDFDFDFDETEKKPAVKPTAKPAKPATKPESKKAAEQPDNNRFVLGGRSPFISTTVEKRPLSGGAKTMEPTSREEQAQAKTKPRGRFVPYNEPMPHKNIYSRTVEKEKKMKKDDFPTVVVGTAPKGSKISLIIAIILTVILGAIVGAIAYLVFFQ